MESKTPKDVYENEVILLDVRTPQEYDSEHIKGAYNVPLHRVKEISDALKHTDQEIITICRSGKRAATACAALTEEGHGNVYVLEGGMQNYSAKYETELGTPTWSIERQVRFAAGLLVLIGSVLAATTTPWMLLLTGFVGAGLTYSGITDTCGMGLLLSRAPWNTKSSRVNNTINQLRRNLE